MILSYWKCCEQSQRAPVLRLPRNLTNVLLVFAYPAVFDQEILSSRRNLQSCEKAPCTDLKSDPTLHQNSTGLRKKNADAKHERRAWSHKPNYTRALSCQETCFTLDSHMLTSDSFFSLQTQHDQSQGNTNTTNKPRKERTEESKIMCSLCRPVLC